MNASELKRTTGRLAPLVAAMTLFLVPTLSAQEPPEPLGAPAPPDQECTCAWNIEGPRGLRPFMMGDRARIGVALGEPTDANGRTGIRLEDVVEDGPAAEAGLREGDILLALNGTELGDEPTRRLLELLGDVDPGDTVTLTYSREGDERTATVVTDEAEAHSFFYSRAGRPGAWRMEQMAPLRRALVAPRARMHVRELLGRGGLDLVAMNEALGEYFDVSEGVLVAEVDDDSALGLEAGDVILTIGGRDVRDPAHARAILGSYRADESITFEIVRDSRRMTVTGTRSGG